MRYPGTEIFFCGATNVLAIHNNRAGRVSKSFFVATAGNLTHGYSRSSLRGSSSFSHHSSIINHKVHVSLL